MVNEALSKVLAKPDGTKILTMETNVKAAGFVDVVAEIEDDEINS